MKSLVPMDIAQRVCEMPENRLASHRAVLRNTHDLMRALGELCAAQADGTIELALMNGRVMVCQLVPPTMDEAPR